MRNQLRAPVVVTLSTLLHRYFTESAAFLDNSDVSQRDAKTRGQFLLKYFGAECEVEDLTADDVTAYARWRLAGGIIITSPVTGKLYKSRPARMSSAEGDLEILYAALRWATTVRVGKRKRLLMFHPLQGVRRPREHNIRRPMATWERYLKTREATQALAATAEIKYFTAHTDSGRVAASKECERWVRMELFLVLLEATGRRAGSIRQLRWQDINLDAGEITWRAAADKKRHDWLTPIPKTLRQELETFRHHLGDVERMALSIGENPKEYARGDVLPRQLLRAERYANLPKLLGGVCHPYRRKWATERKDLPLKDVAATGG